MAGTLINLVVDKYLSHILEIDKDKTKTSLFGGTVEMENLRVKPSMFDNMNLPYIEVVQGFVGKIHVSFSPLTFWKNPIKVKISQVFIYLRQKSVNKLKETDEIQKMEDYKWNKLLAWEELQNQMGDVKYEPGMMDQIINNILIEVEDVVIRFEDRISYPVFPFTFGLVLRKAVVKSTDYTFDENLDKAPVSDITYKIIKTEGLNIYLDYSNNFSDISINNKTLNNSEIRETAGREVSKMFNNDESSLDFYSFCLSEVRHNIDVEEKHNYLLWNFCPLLRVSYNSLPKQNFREKIILGINVPSLNANITTRQTTLVLKLLAYISLNSYYTIGIEKKHYKNQVSEDYSKEYVELYTDYYKFKYEKKYKDLNAASKLEVKIKEKERGYTFNQISSLREITIMNFLMKEKMSDLKNQEDGYNNRWRVTSYFTSNNDKAALDDLAKKKKQLEEEALANENKVQELVKKQELEYKDEEANEYADFPRNYVFFALDFRVGEINFKINRDLPVIHNKEDFEKHKFDVIKKDFNNTTNNNKDHHDTGVSYIKKSLIEMNTTEILLQTEIGGKVGFKKIHFSISKFSIKQNVIQNEAFQYLINTVDISDDYSNEIKTMEKKVEDLNIPNDEDIKLEKDTLTNISINNKESSKIKEANKVLSINILLNPEDPVSEYRLEIKSTKQLVIIANSFSLFYIQNKLMSAIQSEINLEELNTYAQSEISKYVKQGKKYASQTMKENSDKRFTMLLNVILVAPIIIVPQDILNKNTDSFRTINISIGLMHIYSDIIGKSKTKAYLDSLESLNLKEILNDESKVKNDLNSLQCYDNYCFTLKGLSISTSNNFNIKNIGEIANYETNNHKQNLLHPFNFGVRIKSIINSNDPINDNLIVDLNLESVKITSSDLQLKLLLETMNYYFHHGWLLEKTLNKENKIENYVNNRVGLKVSLGNSNNDKPEDVSIRKNSGMLKEESSFLNKKISDKVNNNDTSNINNINNINDDNKSEKTTLKMFYDEEDKNKALYGHLEEEDKNNINNNVNINSSGNHDGLKFSTSKNSMIVNMKIMKIYFSILQTTTDSNSNDVEEEFLSIIINLLEFKMNKTISNEMKVLVGLYSMHIFDKKISSLNSNSDLDCLFSSNTFSISQSKENVNKENNKIANMSIEELKKLDLNENSSLSEKFFFTAKYRALENDSKIDIKMSNITCLSMLSTIRRLTIFSNFIVTFYNKNCEDVLLSQTALQEEDYKDDSKFSETDFPITLANMASIADLKIRKTLNKELLRKNEADKIRGELAELNPILEVDEEDNDEENFNSNYKVNGLLEENDENTNLKNNKKKDVSVKDIKSVTSSKLNNKNYMFKDVANKINQRKFEEKSGIHSSQIGSKYDNYVNGIGAVHFMNKVLYHPKFYKKIDKILKSEMSFYIKHIDLLLPMTIQKEKNKDEEDISDIGKDKETNNNKAKVNSMIKSLLQDKYLHFNFNLCFKSSSLQETQEVINKSTNKTEYIKYNTLDSSMRVYLSKMGLSLLEFNQNNYNSNISHNNNSSFNKSYTHHQKSLEVSSIFKDLKIILDMNTNLNLIEKSICTGVNFNIDPIKMNIGVKELICFQHYSAILSSELNEILSSKEAVTHGESEEIAEQKKKLREIKKKEKIKEKKQRSIYSQDEQEKNIDKISASDIESKHNFKSNAKIDFYHNNSNIKEDLPPIAALNSDTPLTNIQDFNKMMDVLMFIHHIEFKLIDNISTYFNNPILKLDFKNLDIKYISNSDPIDIDNISLSLVEIVSKIKTNKSLGNTTFENPYNIQSLSQFLNMTYNVQLSLYNNMHREWEPLIEKINFEINLTQVIKRMRMNLGLHTHNDLNINVTPRILSQLKKLGDFFAVDSDGEYINWSVDTIRELKEKQLREEEDDIDHEYASNNKNESEEKFLKGKKPYLEVVNHMGVDCDVFFDASPNQFFPIKDRSSLIFTKKQVKSFYKNCTEEALLLNKHKLSFRFKMEPIKGVINNEIDANVNYTNNYIDRNKNNTIANYENASVFNNVNTIEKKGTQQHENEVLGVDFSYNHIKNYTSDKGYTVNCKITSGGKSNLRSIRLGSNVNIENNTSKNFKLLLLEKKFVHQLKQIHIVKTNTNHYNKQGSLRRTGNNIDTNNNNETYNNLIFDLKDFSKFRFPLEKIHDEYELRFIPEDQSDDITKINSFSDISQLEEYPLLINNTYDLSNKNLKFLKYLVCLENEKTSEAKMLKEKLRNKDEEMYNFSKILKIKDSYVSFDLLVIKPNTAYGVKNKLKAAEEDEELKEIEDKNDHLNSFDFYYSLSFNNPIVINNRLPIKVDINVYERTNAIDNIETDNNNNNENNSNKCKTKEDYHPLQYQITNKVNNTLSDNNQEIKISELESIFSASFTTLQEEQIDKFNFSYNPIIRFNFEDFNNQKFSTKHFNINNKNYKVVNQNSLITDSDELHMTCDVYPESFYKRKLTKTLSNKRTFIFASPFKLSVRIENIKPKTDFDLDNFQIINYQTKAKKINIFIDTIIINKLDYGISIKEKSLGKLNKDIEFARKELEEDRKNEKDENNDSINNKEKQDLDEINSFNFGSSSISFFTFHNDNIEKKAMFKSDNTSWTDSNANFVSLNSLGMNGVISFIEKRNRLNEEIADNNSLSNVILKNAALIIKSSTNLNLSTLIIIEPRYVIVNKIGIPLEYQSIIYEDGKADKKVLCSNNNLDINETVNIDFNLLLNDLPKIKREKEEMRLSKSLVKNNDPSLIKKLRFRIPVTKPTLLVNEEAKDKNSKNSGEDNNKEESLYSNGFNVEDLDEIDFYIPIPENNTTIFNSQEENSLKIIDINNEKRLLVNISSKSNDQGLIIIKLSTPHQPQFKIQNNTYTDIKVRQGNTKQEIKIHRKSSIKYAYNDNSIDEKFIELDIQGKKFKANFNKLEKVKSIKINKQEYFISIVLDNGNQTRILKIDEQLEDDLSDVKLYFIRKQIPTQIKFNMHIKSIGISLVDKQMTELLFLSLYWVDLKLYSTSVNNNLSIDETYNLEFYVKNFQIDYCLDDSYKILLHPKHQIIPQTEKDIEKDDKDIIPFFQLLVCRKTSVIHKSGLTTLKYPQVDFIMQEMCLKLDQFALNRILNFSSSLTNALYEESAFNRTSTKKEYRNIVDVEPELDFNLNDIEKLKSESLKESAARSENTNESLLLIEALMLSALKLSITLRIDITSLDVSLLPNFAVTILGSVGNAIARITNAPLSFNELVIQECFTTKNKLMSNLIQHYSKRGITQFYKILGSSDLIGNPIGLVDKLGTGFMEFFNEPRKGFLQGPSAFGIGLAKGVGSLVTNVVGGGLDSVGKITGTLLNVSRDLRGEKHEVERDEDEPSNLAVGAYSGIKGK